MLLSLTAFLSAFLLFQVQLIIAKYILPWWGGTPAVWATCLVFFQILLLAGYAYAHWASSRWHRAHTKIHAALSLAVLGVMIFLALRWPSPITPGVGWKPATPEHPVLHILLLLAASVGLPFFLLSATAPLSQLWLSKLRPGSSPYWLYALSNFGSLLGLLSYPFVVEPYTRLHTQSWIWSGGFALFVLACMASIASVRKFGTANESKTTAEARSSSAPVPASQQVLWFSLAACASVMLLATTNVITQEVAVIPLLWVLPLCIYLMTFILCFESDRWYRPRIFYLLFVAASAAACYVLPRIVGQIEVSKQIVIFGAVLFVLCMVCHGELVRLKPAASQLTRFYLIISAGGAAGGAFVSLLAPLIFPTFWEYDIGLVACGGLLLWLLWRDRSSWLHASPPWLAGAILLVMATLPHWWLENDSQDFAINLFRYLYYPALILIALVVLKDILQIRRGRSSSLSRGWIAFLCIIALLAETGDLVALARQQFRASILTSRNFYGEFLINEVNELGPEFHAYVMLHAQVRHGLQLLDPKYRRFPTTYYSPGSGAGTALMYHPHRLLPNPQQQALNIGIVGLGAGTLAAYGKPGDTIRYYEINPEVIRVAQGPRPLFTFVGDSAANVTVVPGDARLSLEREAATGQLQDFDVLVIDAFNSDSIPVHLLTQEAFALYLKHLRPDGLLAIHLSNAALDLTPVVMGLADSFHLERARFTSPKRGYFVDITSPNHGRFVAIAQWIVLSREKTFFDQLEVLRRVDVDVNFRPTPLWTDDYSNLFLVLKNWGDAQQAAATRMREAQ